VRGDVLAPDGAQAGSGDKLARSDRLKERDQPWDFFRSQKCERDARVGLASAAHRFAAQNSTGGQSVSTFFFTSTADGGNRVLADELDLEALYCVAMCRRALDEETTRFANAADPVEADYIMFIEPPRHKFEGYGRVLCEHPLIQRFAERCFVYDWADGAAGFLPGVYASLRRSQWDPCCLMPGGFLRPYNEAVVAAATEIDGQAGDVPEPPSLLSFRGHESHPVRTRLARTPAVVEDPQIDFSMSREWFNHSADQKRDHVTRLLSGKFALCPRGWGPATFRTYEAMALGRAPVIVSDEWIAPEGPDWTKFAIVVNEARIADLPRIVREHEHEWAAMGRAAHQAWKTYFAGSPGVISMLRAVERISLARERGETYDELRSRWSSRRFKRANGWDTTQRVARLVTSPEARRRLQRRLRAA
jgi:Exostosin family